MNGAHNTEKSESNIKNVARTRHLLGYLRVSF